MSMNEPSLVSVIIPAFNAESTIAETLRSVAGQTHRYIEIIIVDDGSTDSTSDIVRAFCRSEPRARLVQQQNGGLSSARNRGIAEARGSWIAPIDADDLWHPSFIEKQLARAVRAPGQPGFVYCWYHLVDSDSRVLGTRWGWEAQGPALSQLAYENFVGNGSSLLFGRELAIAVGGYSEEMRFGCEDLLFELMLARDHPIACVPEYLVGYRIRSGTMSRDTANMKCAWKMVYDWLRRCAPSVPSKVIRWNKGIRSFESAEARSNQGDWLGALFLLGRALWLDPIRCGAFLLYRLLRSVARILPGQLPLPPRPLFNDVKPTDSFPLPPYELTGLVRLLGRIDARRLRALAEIDGRISEASHEAPLR